MIPVQLQRYLCFPSGDGIIRRDVRVPAIVPGMRFAGIFGLENDPCEVVTWEFDVEQDCLIAWLPDEEFTEDHWTFAQLEEKGHFAGWDVSDFHPAAGPESPGEAGPGFHSISDPQ